MIFIIIHNLPQCPGYQRVNIKATKHNMCLIETNVAVIENHDLLNERNVVFIEHKMLYKLKGEVPGGEHIVPFGQAAVKKSGSDITLVGVGYQVQNCLAAADVLESEGISVEVIDPRTIAPLDVTSIAESVRKTNRCVIVEEGHLRSGVGSEISASIQEEVFDYLDAPIARVAALNAPIPFEPKLEDFILPNPDNIVEVSRKVLGVSF